MAKRIALVSCGKVKLDHPAPAKDLYRSNLFKLTRQYVEPRYDEWLILSGLHHVLRPDDLITPYNQRVPTKRDERQAWGMATAMMLNTMLPDPCYIDIFAGEDYVSTLRPDLIRAGHTVGLPMEGLQVGQRQGWLKMRLG